MKPCLAWFFEGFCAFSLMLSLSILPATAQTAAVTTEVRVSSVPTSDAALPGARPKIGLVLSGGGARGLAHIGVLRWFEEHRIPVDYIAGTSMGGLVGGMYATGMSPEEMRALIQQLDWDAVLGGTPAYEGQPIKTRDYRT